MLKISRSPITTTETFFDWHIGTPAPGETLVQPTHNKNETIKLCGWACCANEVSILIQDKHRTVTQNMNVNRPDILEFASNKGFDATKYPLKCGFHYNFPALDIDWLKIGFLVDETQYWVIQIDILRIKALEGAHGWLFLDNDTNYSIDQFTGRITPSQEDLKAWSSYIHHVNLSTKDIACRWGLSLAPSKEELFPDYYPFNRAKKTSIDYFIQTLDPFDCLIYPLKDFHESRYQSYCKIDTHWSDYGAHIAAKSILQHFGLNSQTKFLKQSFIVQHVTGDLGNKFTPPRKGMRLYLADIPPSSKLIYNNTIINHGNIKIYHNEKSPLNEKLVIFGDSFATNLSKILSQVFRDVIVLHSAGILDCEILLFEKPQYMLLQTNQRFIIKAPQKNFSIWDIIQKKVCKMDSVEKSTLLQNLQSQNRNNYTSKMVNILNSHSTDPD